MKHHSTSSQRLLATAVAVALAAPVCLASPAFAAGPATPPASAQATEEAVAPLTVPADSVLVSAGRTGMLTRTGWGEETVHRWTRLSDGVTTTLPAGPHWGSPGTDLVASRNGAVYTLTDMSGAREPVVIDTSGLDSSGSFEGVRRVVGTTLVVARRTDGRTKDHLVSVEDGRVVDRPIELPDGSWTDYDPTFDAGPGRLVVEYSRSTGTHSRHLSVVDMATGALSETYAFDGNASAGEVVSVSLAGDRLALLEGDDAPALATVVRGTQDVQRVALKSNPDAQGDLVLRTVGDWAVYARADGGTSSYPDSLHTLTARPLAGGAPYPLMDHMSSSAYDADGNLLVLGGTLAKGEGLYRIAPDPTTGRLAAVLVRGFGTPTALTLLEERPLSGTIDFDRSGGEVRSFWRFSRHNVLTKLTLTHTATGTSVDVSGVDNSANALFPWYGRFGDGLPAYNGAYTWKMTSTPANAIGPAVERKGSFTLTRAPRPHDFDGNGSPDLLVRSGGSLSMFDVGQARVLGPWQDVRETRVGDGWNTYDRIASTGNLGGTRNGDIVARDRTGVLWFYEGRAVPGNPFATRVRIGGGWQAYDRLAGGSDLTGDGRDDLLATDKAGALWLYPGTGNAAKPFAPRKRIGSGWGAYNQLTATGNLAGGPAGDLVARDRAGVLWLYLGKGDGTFAPRTKVGAGWGPFKALVGAGDVDGDGRNDLVAHQEPTGNYPRLSVYRGTGQWKAPFAGAQTTVPRYEGWSGDVY
ncbi:FG-GAP repeat domain-containing protein [Streptomyces sp. NPDC014861]|uniref:FG-GAP repeat domain-containing protein n=1 Tax=Streptomyces sp. NPDC014861 TaxID=3364923 RepID=UPI00370255FE